MSTRQQDTNSTKSLVPVLNTWDSLVGILTINFWWVLFSGWGGCVVVILFKLD